MFMDDDDEFGELYSDILPSQPAFSPKPSLCFPAVAASSANLFSNLSSVAASPTNPIPHISYVPALSTNSIPNLSSVSALVSKQNLNSRIRSSDALDGLIYGEPNGDCMPDNWDDDDGNLEDNNKVQPEARWKMKIPAVVKGEDWDSDDDSEDDLKILLYDDSVVVETNKVEKEDILISYDNNDCIQEGNQDINGGESERKDDDLENAVCLDGLKANEVLRDGNRNYGQQQQSMFKYVRPVATVADSPGQIHPPTQTVVPIADHGRGEWRPNFGLKNHGSGWTNNNASRPFGGGLDFILPSYKTIFDVDIEVFEEKRWRHQGVDTSDFFNFGLNVESWKVYARQLAQLRIESTMQSKISVHQSDRSTLEYDPDLPPELAAAAGNHDVSANILLSGRIDKCHSDLNGQPVGRPIVVETGNGERMPSAETRPPRPHDPDVIIEVFPCDRLVDETAAHDDAFELPDKDLEGEKCNGIGHADYDGRGDAECGSHASRYFNDDRKEIFDDRHRENGSFITHRGRSTERPSRRRQESENGKDNGCLKEKRENSMSAKSSPNQSPGKADSAKREPSIQHTDGMEDSITHSSRNHKLSSKVEPINKDGINNDLRNTPSATGLQNGRWRNGSMRRHTNDNVRERRHEMVDRKRMPYPNRDWDHPYPMRSVRGSPFWRERKSMVNGRIDRDDGLKMRERSLRAREWKDEDYQRREKGEKGGIDRRKREKEKNVEDHEREVEDKKRNRHSYDDHRSRRAVEKDNDQIIDKRQHKEGEDLIAHENKCGNNDRGSRVHNSRPSGGLDEASKEMHKESARRDKDPLVNVQNLASRSRRKREGSTDREKVSSKLMDEKQKEENDDEMEGETKRGRSKVERWSNDMKEEDMAANEDTVNESIKQNGNGDTNNTEGHPEPEMLEKLKRRRERFKAPLTCEKGTPSSSKVDETDLLVNESEVKAERPPRKRRWMSN